MKMSVSECLTRDLQSGGFKLSVIAEEIRSGDRKYAMFHDDYTCLAEYTSDNANSVLPSKIEFHNIKSIGMETTEFYTRIFNTRKKLLAVHSSQAESCYAEFKASLASLPQDNLHVIGMKKFFGGSEPIIGMVSKVEGLHAILNSAYRVKAGAPAGRTLLEQIAGNVLEIFDSLINTRPISDEFFQNISPSYAEFVRHISELLLELDPVRRSTIISQFKAMMTSIISCFVLYRTPVMIVRGQKPIYLSHFVPLIKLAPFLTMFGLNLSMFVIEA
jgi:hypothetical protein